VESLAALSELAGRDLSGLDPHRPFVDSVTFACPSCGGLAQRVPEVIDVWYDSGSMPFAQFGAPWRDLESFEAAYPAQFICEAIDQTRGWFYSLMAVGTMVFGRSAYENVLCLGLLVDEQGRKMSKHLGNVLEPLPLMETHGADALRWFFAVSGSPWAARRVSTDALADIVRKVLLTYWNTTSFLVLYANASGSGGSGGMNSPQERGVPGGRPPGLTLLDRWVLSELHSLVRDVTSSLESFDSAGAGRRIAGFIDDLSNWYVRRSRRRFWDGDEGAFATLHECVVTLTLLMAPFTPFVTDYVWGVLVGSSSVHLASWPSVDESVIDSSLSEQMALARRLVELGRSARASASVRTRQPLSRALVAAPGFSSLPTGLLTLVAEELNVASVDVLSRSDALVDYSVKPAYRALGQRFGSSTQAVAAAISAADPTSVASAVLGGGTFTVVVDGTEVVLGPSDVVVTQTPRAGWAVASDGGETVALDTTITDELRSLGLAREVVRLIQDARKDAGFDVGDRIWLRWSAGDASLGEALTTHGPLIAREVLAVDFGLGPEGSEGREYADPALGLRFWLRRA
jgi:isoleucyl-tRNA synthetase